MTQQLKTERIKMARAELAQEKKVLHLNDQQIEKAFDERDIQHKGR